MCFINEAVNCFITWRFQQTKYSWCFASFSEWGLLLIIHSSCSQGHWMGASLNVAVVTLEVASHHPTPLWGACPAWGMAEWRVSIGLVYVSWQHQPCPCGMTKQSCAAVCNGPLRSMDRSCPDSTHGRWLHLAADWILPLPFLLCYSKGIKQIYALNQAFTNYLGGGVQPPAAFGRAFKGEP